ncbi:hypothetical protein ACJX0J_005443, partial [Zea mays]
MPFGVLSCVWVVFYMTFHKSTMKIFTLVYVLLILRKPYWNISHNLGVDRTYFVKNYLDHDPLYRNIVINVLFNNTKNRLTIILFALIIIFWGLGQPLKMR